MLFSDHKTIRLKNNNSNFEKTCLYFESRKHNILITQQLYPSHLTLPTIHNPNPHFKMQELRLEEEFLIEGIKHWVMCNAWKEQMAL